HGRGKTVSVTGTRRVDLEVPVTDSAPAASAPARFLRAIPPHPLHQERLGDPVDARALARDELGGDERVERTLDARRGGEPVTPPVLLARRRVGRIDGEGLEDESLRARHAVPDVG